MHCISALSVAFAIPLLVHAQKKYYIDKSCSDRLEWKDAFDLARNNAKKRLQNISIPLPIPISKPWLTVCSRRVQRTKTSKARFPRSDPPPGPLGVLKANSNAHASPLADIASWVEVEQKATALETLKPADVRLFCDNEKCMTPSKNCLRSSITYLAGI